MPLHELFYYDDIKTLKAAVNAMPRVAVFSALSKPNVYLDVSKPCICFSYYRLSVYNEIPLGPIIIISMAHWLVSVSSLRKRGQLFVYICK